MRFELDDDLIALRDLVERVFAENAGTERVREVELSEDGFDRRLWRTLADAGALGAALPEPVGGAGLGMLGLVTLLEQQGRRVAPVPLWAVLSLAALPMARFGSPQQVARWLPGLIAGTSIVTGSFDTPPVALTAGRLSGELVNVPAAVVAAAVVLPARRESGELAVAVVPIDRAGVRVTPVAVTSRESYAAVSLDGVEVSEEDLLPGDGEEIVRWVRERARLALAAVQLGVCEEALAMTAAYTSQREQFGRPLSANQGVAMRAADAYLDTESIRLTVQYAAWLMDTGQDERAARAALVAKWWASRGGLRTVHATQHLHGGIGADIEYPIHRYFLWGRQIAFTLGGADAVAAELGDLLRTGATIGAPE